MEWTKKRLVLWVALVLLACISPCTRASAQDKNELINAAGNGDLPRVRALLGAKADVNAKTNDGATALMLASELGHTNVVRALLGAKADVNAKNIGGWTSLMLASSSPPGSDYADVVRALLNAKADVNAKNATGTALVWASALGHEGVVRALLDFKADVNPEDIWGRTPLDEAAGMSYMDVAELLLANHAEVNAKNNYGQTPLLVAAANGHKDLVQLLLLSNADVNARDNKGLTPLHWAGTQVYNDVAELLRQHGGLAEPTGFEPRPATTAPTNRRPVTITTTDGAIHAAARNGDVAEVQALVKGNPDLVFSKGDDGATPLLVAASAGHIDVVQLLLANEADVNAADIWARTPAVCLVGIPLICSAARAPAQTSSSGVVGSAIGSAAFDATSSVLLKSMKEASANVSIGPKRLDFNRVVLGERAMSVVVVTNGTKAAIEVESLAMPVGFQLATVKLPLTIPNQTQALLTVTFVPTRAGTYHGTLDVSYRTSNVSRPRRMGIILTGKGSTK